MITFSILNWIYPPRCIFCNNIIALNLYSGFDVCQNCIPKLPFIKEPTCKKCGKSIKSDNELCDDCLIHTHSYKKCWVAVEYDDMVKESIYSLKYKSCPNYSKSLAEIMYIAMSYKDIFDYKFDFVTSVPIHKNRLKTRGYNQAELLAKQISSRLNIEYKNLLLRIKDTKPQNILSPKERYNNLKDAFILNDNNLKSGSKVLIIDDILTTGATVDICSDMLAKSGLEVYCYILSATASSK